MIKLYPCPDCGSDFIIPLYITPAGKKDKEYVYFCNGCHKVSQSAKTKEDAAAYWNQAAAENVAAPVSRPTGGNT